MDFLGTGPIVADLKHVGMNALLRDVLKMFVNTSASWSVLFPENSARDVIWSSGLPWGNSASSLMSTVVKQSTWLSL